ncbi:unnamed protein product, partial [Trichobilharzia szidati]
TIPIHYPMLTDYLFDVNTLMWIPWSHLVPEYIHDVEARFTQILVPTVETVKLNWILMEHIK